MLPKKTTIWSLAVVIFALLAVAIEFFLLLSVQKLVCYLNPKIVCQEEHRFTEHNRPILSVAISPDGTQLASGSWDNTIRLWNVSTGAEVHRISKWPDIAGVVSPLAFSPDGSRLTSVSLDSTIRLWNVATGEEVRYFTVYEGRITFVAFSPDGTQIAFGADDNIIRLWSVDTGEEMYRYKGHEHRVRSIVFSPDGT